MMNMPMTGMTGPGAAARRLSAERWFFTGMALAMVAVIVAGFAPSYYLRGAMDPGHPLLPMTAMVHLHGIVFTGWMMLFVAQTMLVNGGRTDIHMKLGLTAFALLPVMVAIATISALQGVARHSGPPIVSPLSWLAIPLLDVPVFAGLILWGLMRRRDPGSHKRLMTIAMIGMTSPGVGRLPWPPTIPGPIILFGFSDLFLIALILWDLKTLGRVHRATIAGGLFLVGSQVFRIAIWQTPAWLAFAGWAAGLVG